MSSDITVEQLQRAMPKGMGKNITTELVDRVNQVVADPYIREVYRDNLLSYASVMRDGKFKMDSYLDAVRYVSHKLLGDSNIAAYTKTFPARFQDFINRQVSEKDIASYVSSYNKNKLVNLIFEQTLIPTHVLNADLYQSAINVQVELMKTAKSEKVRSDAANSVMTHLKPPETKKIELDVGVKDAPALTELREAQQELAMMQQKMIKLGVLTADDTAKSPLTIENSTGEPVKDKLFI